MHVPKGQVLSASGDSCEYSLARVVIWKSNITEGKQSWLESLHHLVLARCFLSYHICPAGIAPMCFPVMLMGIGLALAIVGIAAIFSNR